MTRVSKQDGGNKLTITCRKRRRKEGWNKLCNLKIGWMDSSWQVNRNSGRDQRENLFLDGQDDEWLQCPVHGQQHMDTENWRDREREEEGREEREWGVCVCTCYQGKYQAEEWEWVSESEREWRESWEQVDIPFRFASLLIITWTTPHTGVPTRIFCFCIIVLSTILFSSTNFPSILLSWRQPEALPVIKRPVSSAAQSRYQHDQNVINKTKVSTQPRYQHNRSINKTETNPSRCSVWDSWKEDEVFDSSFLPLNNHTNEWVKLLICS